VLWKVYNMRNPRKSFRSALFLAFCVSFGLGFQTNTAHAAPYKFIVSIGGGLCIYCTNPGFTIFNKSENGAEITRVAVTINDPNYYFDYVYDFKRGGSLSYPTGTAYTPSWGSIGGSRVSGDLLNDKSGSNTIEYTLESFYPGFYIGFSSEIDDYRPSNAPHPDYRKILFNNGDTPNAVVSVDFLLGNEVLSLSIVLTDDLNRLAGSRYSFTATSDGPSADVPEPVTIALFSFGLLSIGAWRRRHRNSPPLLNSPQP
jgi:hypothetical protein